MNKNISPSVRLKKIESVYKKVKKESDISIQPNKTKQVSNKSETVLREIDSGKGRKKLTEYQKFVQKESQKEKYKNLKPDERIKKIAKAWKRQSSKIDNN